MGNGKWARRRELLSPQIPVPFRSAALGESGVFLLTHSGIPAIFPWSMLAGLSGLLSSFTLLMLHCA